MENNLSLSIYKSITEKNACIINTALKKRNQMAVSSSPDFALAEFDQDVNESVLEMCSKLSFVFEKLLNDPEKIIGFLREHKINYVNNKHNAIRIGDKREMVKSQWLIDEVIDPLLDSCADALQEQLFSKKEIHLENITTEPFHKEAEEPVADIIEEPVTVNLPQIKCKATPKQILFYFMILAKEKNPVTGKPYMTEKDVRAFVKLNFVGCGKPGFQRYFEIGTEVKGTLTYFVLQFYQKYGYNKNDKMHYVQLLISNFKIFANSNAINLLSNMNPSKIPSDPENVINIQNYYTINK